MNNRLKHAVLLFSLLLLMASVSVSSSSNSPDTGTTLDSSMTYGEADSLVELNNKVALDQQIKEIISRPEFEGGDWGMEFSLPDTDETIYSLNREEFYNPASAIKIFTAGMAYAALGSDYRFHTPIYRTGPVVDGVLEGDLILQASGDLLLGGRVNPDGTLNLPETDHSYGTSADTVPVSDNPLGSFYEFAEQIAANGITKIEGNIIVDNSLYREGKDSLGGTGEYSISPMMINDNLVDVWVMPGEKEGDPATIKIMPDTPYVTIINEVTTVAPGEDSTPGSTPGMITVGQFSQKPKFENDITNPDGTHTVTLFGSVKLGDVPTLCTYNIPEPARFAEIALKMVLEEMGISSNIDLLRSYDFDALSSYYKDENKVAEIVSPSLRDELLPMMKLSSNLHTAAWPYLVGAISGKDPENARIKGFEIQAEMYKQAGVDVDVPLENLQEVSEIRYSPKSYTSYLKYLYDLPYFDEYITILPILGVDGTLSDIDPNLTAAGHVFAKTGTGMTMAKVGDAPPQAFLVKALAGFIEFPDGQIVTFSIFADYATSTPNPAPAQEAIGDIVNAVYEYVSSSSESGMTYEKDEEDTALITSDTNNAELDSTIKEIISRPEFEGGHWGMEFSLLDTDETIYSLNREEFYRPASALKVFTAGTAYAELGADFRFHTPIYRTGQIDDGVLKGDLVLQASGDLLLGGRVNPDGTINIPLTDHTYRFAGDAVPVSDNPLGSFYIFADQIAASGITSIEGDIIVDDSLFRGSRDNLDGTGEYSISPIVINDNLIDIWVIPGENEGDLASLQIMPKTPYVTFINEVTTVAPNETSTGLLGVFTTGGRFSQGLVFENETQNPDGTYTVTLSGTVNLNEEPRLNSYVIPEPERFAEVALKMILEDKGIESNIDLLKEHDFKALSSYYTDENKVAEIVSPSLRDELLPMMKLSSNMHTAAWPYIIGAVAGNDSENAKMKGYEMQAALFWQTGVTTNSNLENLHEVLEVRYSPNDYTNFLNHLYKSPYYEDYVSTLCIMGIDGHLNSIRPDLAASGHVFAKPGVTMAATPSPEGKMQPSITSALAGFMESDGRVVSFSIFTEYPTRTPNPDIAQIAIGDILNAVYEYMAILR
jgi:D-alanyl-D-alanine carboxypeptidase/D-alanyl-D-alanine-endopeptidase (penicillin-binding protein 4)